MTDRTCASCLPGVILGIRSQPRWARGLRTWVSSLIIPPRVETGPRRVSSPGIGGRCDPKRRTSRVAWDDVRAAGASSGSLHVSRTLVSAGSSRSGRRRGRPSGDERRDARYYPAGQKEHPETRTLCILARDDVDEVLDPEKSRSSGQGLSAGFNGPARGCCSKSGLGGVGH